MIGNQDIVTKRDLRKLKLELIKWILCTGVATIIILAGLLKLIN